MTVDVSCTIEIERNINVVAGYAIQPDNAPIWYENIKSVEWKTPRPLQLGSSFDFVAHFMGRRMAYTYEVVTNEPNLAFAMRATDGPFPMETHYEWEALGQHRTRMTLRNRGGPSGIMRVFSPVLRGAMKRANTKDLANLKFILEQEAT